MNFVFIIGEAAVGKMTVGQELSRLTGYPLFYNHLTIEPVVAMFGEFRMDVINKLRDVFFEEFKKSDLPGVIFTVGTDYSSTHEADYIADVMQKVGPADFYCLELHAPVDVRLTRAATSNRLEHKPSQRDVVSARRYITSKHQIADEDLVGYFCRALPFKQSMLVENDGVDAHTVAWAVYQRFRLFEE